jgi:hypothetical protein
MREIALPASIFALALAVFVHALTPAHADIPPEEPIPATPTALPALTPECKPIRLGTTHEYEKVISELVETGRTEVMVVGTGLVCGWR